MEQQIIVSCLGRPMELGMLYDCRSDTPVPGVALWDITTFRSDIKQLESSEFKINADDSMEKKADFMNIEAEVKLSFLGGLVKVEGAAKYFENNKSSAHQARVVLKYSCKTNFEQLTMNCLAIKNIEYPEAFDKNMATHVVTAIEYGADAFFVFDRHLNSSENCRDIEGKLEVSLANLPIISKVSIEGAGAGHMSEENRRVADSFKCTFHGDIVLKENPTTFEDAVAIYKRLPSLIRETMNRGNIYGVPKKAYLYPLSKLDNKAAKLVRHISDHAVSETQSLLEHIIKTLASANDLENFGICNKLFGIKQQIIKFKSYLAQFRNCFQRVLCETLPQIRGGGMEESMLLKWIQQVRRSPYDPKKLDAWIDLKKREFSCIQSYLNSLEPYPFAFQPGELEGFTQNDQLKYVLCLSLASITRCDHPYLDAMKEFSLDDQNEIVIDAWQTLEENWCENDIFMTTLQSQVRLFKNFAAANNENTNGKFVVVDANARRGNYNESPGAIFLYNDGRRQLFQPPTAPGPPQMVSNAENELTIKWTAPEVGVKSVINYTILYQPVGAKSDDWTGINTHASDTNVQLTSLEPGTEYLVKVAANCEFGKSQFSDQSQPIKTKSRPPLAFSILPDCKLVMEGNNGQPSWYQIPVIERHLNNEKRFRKVDIGVEYRDVRKPVKVVLLVGETGSGKSTLINGMVNYLYGVKKDDNFRFQLIPKESNKNQAYSQTSFITEYFFHWHPQSCIPYNLVFIDTPGYADTDGIKKDAEFKQQLKAFFKTAADHIDIIGFVISSAITRLSDTQKYIFDGILSLFSNDVEENISLMVTFADGSPPPALVAVDEYKVRYNNYFKFNSSVFTMGAASAQLNPNDRSMGCMFWDMACSTYKDFFTKLGSMTSQSLTMTKEVLKERHRLEKTIDIFSKKVNDGVSQLVMMREELPFIIEYEAEMNANKEYKRKIHVTKMRRVKFDDGHAVTNCMRCDKTCHDPCSILNDADKARCSSMKDGNCWVCKNRCHWSQHCNRPFVYEDYINEETITIDDMKQKYEEANSNLSLKDNLLKGISTAYNDVQREVVAAIEEIRRCLERLSEIALRPDPLSTVQYIDMLIQATKREKKIGWQQRLDQLENARSRAALIQDMKEKGVTYDPFADLKEEIAVLEAKRIPKERGQTAGKKFMDLIKTVFNFKKYICTV